MPTPCLRQIYWIATSSRRPDRVPRPWAVAGHLGRTRVRALLGQKAVWGAGGAWLDRTYPGSVRLVGGGGLVWWAIRATLRGLLRAVRRRDRDEAIYAVLHPLESLAWQF